REVQINGIVGARQARVGHAGTDGNAHDEIEDGAFRCAGGERSRSHRPHATEGEGDRVGGKSARERESGDPEETVRAHRIGAAEGSASGSRFRGGIGQLAAEGVVPVAVESGDANYTERFSDAALRAEVAERYLA